jgi:hypothetical protein
LQQGSQPALGGIGWQWALQQLAGAVAAGGGGSTGMLQR